MEVILIMGTLTAIGVFIILLKAGIRKFTGYSFATDLIVFIGLTFFFSTGFMSLAIGITAGIVFTILLWIAKLFFGAQRLKRSGRFVRWVDVR